MLAIAVAAVLSIPAAQAPDPSVASWARDAVAVVARRGVMIGFPDGRFHGDWTARRYEAATVFARLAQTLHIETTAPVWQRAHTLLATFAPSTLAPLHDGMFKDVDTSHYSQWGWFPPIELSDRGMVNGYPDGYYRGKRTLTRAGLAAIIARFVRRNPKVALNLERATFHDVDGDEWYFGSILVAAGSGVMGGFADRTFRPSVPVTRNEVALAVARLLTLAKADSP